jgi:hypothetical protein
MLYALCTVFLTLHGSETVHKLPVHIVRLTNKGIVVTKMGRIEVVMGIYASDLRELVIKPYLQGLGEYSEVAENLLLGTAAQESLLGLHCYCAQTRGLGLYRITAEKHRELWDKYLVQFPDLASHQRGLASQQQFLKDPHGELISNLIYTTGMAWMIYRRAAIDTSKPLDLLALAQLWANHFDNGTGTSRNADDFMQTYRSLVMGDANKRVA